MALGRNIYPQQSNRSFAPRARARPAVHRRRQRTVCSAASLLSMSFVKAIAPRHEIAEIGGEIGARPDDPHRGFEREITVVDGGHVLWSKRRSYLRVNQSMAYRVMGRRAGRTHCGTNAGSVVSS